MPNAPAADQQALLQVQDLDTRIQQAEHRRATLPALARLDELGARAGELRQTIAELAAEASDAKRAVAKAEDDVQGVRDRAQRDTDRMNAGGLVSKELVAMQSELDALAKRQADLEDIELEAMEALDGFEKSLAAARAEMAEVEAEIAKAEAERDEEFATIDAQLVSLKSGRADAVAPLDAGLVSLYEKQRTAHAGVGAAALLQGQCQGCHMSLNPADLATIDKAAPDAVVRCEECGRILVRPAA